MKHSRRWAAWLAAILIAASLVVLPREGVASGPFIFGDPPVVDEGEPDVPGSAAIMSKATRYMFPRFVIIARIGPMPTFVFMPWNFPWQHDSFQAPQGIRR